MFTVSWLAVSNVSVHTDARVPNSMEGPMAPTKVQTAQTEEENSTSYGLLTWLVIVAAAFFSVAPFITSYGVH